MRAISHKIRLSTAMLLAMVLGSYLYSASADAAEVRDISRVNSGISVDAEDQVGDLSSVNGGIRMEERSSAHEVSTINGSINLDDGVVVRLAESVNGGIRVGEGVTVNGSLLTVNGGIRTNSGTVVENRVRTVNGRVQLSNTQVGADVQTSNGDITLLDGSVVEGDVVVEGRRHWWDRIFRLHRNPPELTIDASSIVRGDIHLHREVELHIADGAKVGEIIEHFR